MDALELLRQLQGWLKEKYPDYSLEIEQGLAVLRWRKVIVYTVPPQNFDPGRVKDVISQIESQIERRQ